MGSASQPQAAGRRRPGNRAYDEHQRLRTSHPTLLAGKIADLYQRQIASGRTVAITTTTTETARTINRAIQRRQGHPADGRSVELADGTRVHVGDQVATRRNRRDLRTDRGEQVRNRHVWTVTDIRPDEHLAVTHAGRGTVMLPTDYVSGDIELGWAVTGYGNQRDTVDVGIAVLDSGTTRNHAYVALTRGRQSNVAYMPDPTGLLDPAEGIATIVTRPNASDSALATYANLGQQAPTIPPATRRADRQRVPVVRSDLNVSPRPPTDRRGPRMSF